MASSKVIIEHPECLKSDTFKVMNPAESDPAKHCLAAHVVFYVKTDEILYGKHPMRALVLMMLRSDGNFGFPGGIIETGESILDGLNRETMEEVGVNFGVKQEDFLCCHFTEHLRYGRIELHAYAKELNLDQFKEMERSVYKAEHYGTETHGITRVPLVSREDGKGLPTFLKNSFSGNAKAQLLYGMYAKNILTLQEIQDALKR